MIRKTIILFALQLAFGLTLMAQTILYKCDLYVYPESNNKKGCVLSIDEIRQEFDLNNNIKYNFNIQSFLPALDAEAIFETVQQKDWSITLLQLQVVEKLKAENLSEEQSITNLECVFNGVVLPIEATINKKKNKDKTFYNELSFSLTGHQVGANTEEVFLFVLKLTPQ